MDAVPIENTQYGQKYALAGTLTGPNGKTLSVKTIWIVTSQITKLVTLFPN
ncbi:DUF6883 domain-containing protein [Microseira wollei]|uniref:DUF6883 domain-containing protein n=1 Tax=Microseira wollei TaxID=467598 RepID=UPI001CFD5EF5|nr:DUF6883 domain-containing protein [Microseira wollei]